MLLSRALLLPPLRLGCGESLDIWACACGKGNGVLFLDTNEATSKASPACRGRLCDQGDHSYTARA